MQEYLFKVIIDGNEDILKTWSNEIHFAIDNIISLSLVENIISIKEVQSSQTWSFTGNINQLRKLRMELVKRNLLK